MSEDKNDGNTMIMLTGLWLKKSKNGVTYMSGNMGSNRVLMYKNTKKTKDNSPDYFLYLAPPQPKERGAESAESDNDDPFFDLKGE